MKKTIKIILIVLFVVTTKLSFAGEYNLLLLPAPYCHQAGIEKRISENYSTGVIGRFNCHSERPTYGDKNNEVESKFNRALFTIKHSFNKVYSTGPFVQGLAGIEESEFNSNTGTKADVTYINLAVHGGYQWYFGNGFNISVLGGFTHLQEIDSSSQISNSESPSVIDFLNKNIETNNHFSSGIIIGLIF